MPLQLYSTFVSFQSCLEIFDNSKQREDHSCSGVEKVSSGFVCHLHTAPISFSRQGELDEHLRLEHGEEGIAPLQLSCPVCQKVSGSSRSA